VSTEEPFIIAPIMQSYCPTPPGCGQTFDVPDVIYGETATDYFCPLCGCQYAHVSS
jgi:hypothetical protein